MKVSNKTKKQTEYPDNEANDINDLAFSNVLPGVLPRGLKIAGAANYTCYDPTSSQTIAGSGILTALIDTQAIQLSAGVIPDRDAVSSKDGTCTILIPVTAGTDIGDATNYTYIIADGAVMGDDGNVVSNSGEVKQSINITAIGKPSISKSFSSDTVFLGGAASTLTITIENSETVNVADFSITDTFPTANGTPIIKVANLPNISSTLVIMVGLFHLPFHLLQGIFQSLPVVERWQPNQVLLTGNVPLQWMWWQILPMVIMT